MEINLASDLSIKKNSVIARYYKEKSGERGMRGKPRVAGLVSASIMDQRGCE